MWRVFTFAMSWQRRVNAVVLFLRQWGLQLHVYIFCEIMDNVQHLLSYTLKVKIRLDDSTPSLR